MTHEYLVLPAPRRAPRIKGVRDPAERFAMAVSEVMNDAGREGWEYLRTDTLPMEAGGGWFSRPAAVPQELLVFRRPIEAAAPAEEPAVEAPSFSRPGARRDPPAEPARPAPRGAGGGGAVTPLSLRPASERPARPAVSLEERRDAAASSLAPAPERSPPGPPRLGGARRD